jgi:hypothetical protein
MFMVSSSEALPFLVHKFVFGAKQLYLELDEFDDNNTANHFQNQ